MVKLVTVIETQACRTCSGSGHAPNGHICAGCSGSGKIEVEVHR